MLAFGMPQSCFSVFTAETMRNVVATSNGGPTVWRNGLTVLVPFLKDRECENRDCRGPAHVPLSHPGAEGFIHAKHKSSIDGVF